MSFLPLNKKEMEQLGWEQPDFVYITGDAYVDHHSFGVAIISRVLEAHGYKVAILSQPDWKDSKTIREFGEPRLGFLVTAGNMDSMVNHYSVSKIRRKQDAYTAGGVMGKRPDRATIVYCQMIRKEFGNIPIVIGGIEASLRRLGHYDYWEDKVRRSILIDSQADLLLYGMGENSIVEMADALQSGIAIKDITFIRGTVYKTKELPDGYDFVMLPSFDDICNDKKTYAKSFYLQYQNTDPFVAKPLVEPYGTTYVVQNTPAYPLSQEQMDWVYQLPYERTYHPSYEKDGGVPAITEVKFSLVNNRGCYGGCSFCALTFHQGRIIQTRSHESLLEEAKQMIEDKDFKGYIHDVGGPTANFRRPACDKQMTKGACVSKQCLFPNPCKKLVVDHEDYLRLLRKLRALPKVKKVFIRSGIRFDYVVSDKNSKFLEELCEHHVSGQLKVAPEHIADPVLAMMGKPENSVYEQFRKQYEKVNQKLGKKQYLVPYLMSSHPGSTLKEAVALAEYLRDLGYMPEQVQDFYPTPGTISTCMYYTELDPCTMKPVYVPKSPHDKAMQRAFIQYRNPKNYELVLEGLKKVGRMDLVGFDKHCLIPPRKRKEEPYKKEQNNFTKNVKMKNSGKQQGKKKKSIRNVHKKK